MSGSFHWRQVVAIAVGVVMGAATLMGCSSDAGPIVLSFITGAEGAEQYQVAATECSRVSGGRYMIEYKALQSRNTTDALRLNLARRMAAHDTGLDIMQLDVIWTGEFAEAGWILPYPAKWERQVEQGTLRGPLETGRYRGKLYAAPLAANAQLLWYRTDLVPEPPETWDQMIHIAEGLAAQSLPHYIEVQGARYEGLTVWFNTLLTSSGGSILAENGDVRVARGDAARRAVDVMARLARSPAADPSLALSDEDNARLAMQAGRAAFQVNYPFVYAAIYKGGADTFIDSQGRPTSQDTGRRVRDVLGWAAYPSVVAGKSATVTIGGVNLAVSATSQHPDEAFEAVQCLRNSGNQLRNAQGAGSPPTLVALYDDPELQKYYPAWREIRDSLNSASVRPKTPAYKSVSVVISDLLNPPAKIDPNTVVGQLADQITKAVTSQGLVP
jgi:multiple sugar transport system substrate-binding protein